ncbi:cation diffusion facilitator family transporter [Lichenifustis flavocetrariae]|uniref:Cation diffusion facilitator family transporter n=1 Tax=Lichenifustis flavocetrariae TaxID=2949735 RepID=A0AA41Z1W4_9HYPH|nr:cation diffusion facilitator family transporter [Lichenifustis flavocetrariae]MCW6512204.1 cation diffusion facilitator family transporter [Lichenifustis flavocetrariae]
MAESSSKIVIYAALAGNILVTVMKCVAASFTGSSAMLSEAVHSAVDCGNQLLMLLGVHRAARPASVTHPFGHGLQLYFWTFVVAVLVFDIGAGVPALEGIGKIWSPQPVEHPWASYVVIALGLLFGGVTWLVAVRAFRKVKGDRGWIEAVRFSNDPTVFTVLFEDSAALLGLVTALIGIWCSQALGMPVLDGVASLIIGLILAGTAAFLAWECQSLMTGEAAAPEVRRGIRQIVGEAAAVARPNDILTMHFGPRDVLAALSLEFQQDCPAAEVEAAVSRVKQRIKANHPEVTRVFVEAQRGEAHRRSQDALVRE